MKTDSPRLHSSRLLSLLSQPVRLGLGALAAVLLTATSAKIQAATCNGTFTMDESANSWTSNNYQITRFSPDGTKVAIVGGGTFAGAGWSTLVLDVPAMTRNTTLSKTYTSTKMEWTTSGGMIIQDSNWNTQYISPTGAVTNVKPVQTNVSVRDMYPVPGTTKTLMLYGYGSAWQVWVLDDANTSAPTLTQILGFGTSSSATLIYNLDDVITGTATRIYLARSDSSGNPATIKAYNWSGAAVTSNWSDVALDNEPTLGRGDGDVVDMSIRPTDGLVFARINIRANSLALSNLVIFDQNGNIAPSAAFNHDDMSLLGSTMDGSEKRITFDPAGNIYGNLSRASLSANQNVRNMAPWPAGVIKFDPKGNIDFGFMREVVRSYNHSTGAMASSFDVNQATGLVSIINNDSGSFNWAIDPTHRRHDIEQVEHWTGNAFEGGIPTTKYGYVQFWFNSGLLMRPNMDSATAATLAAENCGFQPVVTTPVSSDGAASIDCAKTAFMPAPIQGTAQQLSVLVTLNVTQTGIFNPITFTGSGLTVAPGFTLTASTTGVQQFVIPVDYSGATLSTFDMTIGNAGTCTGNLAQTPTNNTKDAQIKIWTVDNCTYKLAGPALK